MIHKVKELYHSSLTSLLHRNDLGGGGGGGGGDVVGI
jgi:hypothetical protein